MNKIVRFGLAVTLVGAVLATSARAQGPIEAWNRIAEQAVKAVTPPVPPPVAALDFATVHLAIYDAVNSIERHHEPYYTLVPGATGSRIAAAAKAGRDVLVGLFPAREGALEMDYEKFMADNSLDVADPGTAVGAQAAANILTLRSKDGPPSPPPPPYLGRADIGQWRPTPSNPLLGPPPSMAPGLTPWVATVTPFTMDSDAQFRVGPPPQLTSDLYEDNYNEVKSVGASNSTTRTAEQTEIGYFWADSGPVLWQNALRDISQNHVKNIGDAARMYALVEAAMADAQIACWDSKYFYNFWRPIAAISLGDQDGNPGTVGDINWQPLINTPNFPEYPSGHADISGAISHMLQLFFGRDELSFQMTTTNALAPQKLRTFTRFSQAEEEVINARVYVGIHYRNSDVVAGVQGRHVADWVFKNYFRRVDRHRDDDDAGDGARSP
jgi:hypothetical protein